MVKKLSFLIIMGLIPVMVLAANPKPENLPADSLLLLGEQAFTNEEYRLATRYLDYLVLNYPTRDDVPRAQYLLAESYFNLKQFSEASVEYEFLYKQFPGSQYAEEAQIRAAECTFEISEPYYREQELTLTANQMALDFLARFPDSEYASRATALLVKIEEKLARKELEAAKLYFQFDEYQAASMSLEYILETYPGAASLMAETNYYLALCKANLGEHGQARLILESLVDHPVWGKKAQQELEHLPEVSVEGNSTTPETQPEPASEE